MKRRILPFAFAGAVGFVVDACCLLILAPVLGAFGGRLISFCAAVLTTWLINRNFAFSDKAAKAGKGREFITYFGAMLPGAALNWLAYGLVVALAGKSMAGLTLAVAAGSLAGMTTNLIAADRLVFRRKD